MKKKIKVLLVDDSPIAIHVMKRMLDTSSDIEVIATASNGQEALRLIPEIQPNVICTDLHMPDMDGLELTQIIMEKFPLPILVASISVHEEDTHNVFALLQAGAIDVFPKPKGGIEYAEKVLAKELVQKIRVISGVVPIRKHRRDYAVSKSASALPAQKPIDVEPQYIMPFSAAKILAIGASTGGPQTLQTIFSSLTPNYPLPIICVQHISEGFLESLINWLNSNTSLQVKIAEPGETPLKGQIYFPPEKKHLIIDHSGKFSVSFDPPLHGHRPSISITFKSLVSPFRNGIIGVLLTGMGNDGADGLKAIRDAGGVTIAQDEASSVVYGMPKVAKDIGAAKYILSTEKITYALKRLVGSE